MRKCVTFGSKQKMMVVRKNDRVNIHLPIYDPAGAVGFQMVGTEPFLITPFFFYVKCLS